MRAQGLPINFIVIAALAILILILAAGFVVGGGSSFGGAVGPEQIKSTCNSYCSSIQTYAGTIDTKPAGGSNIGTITTTKYCATNITLKGSGAGTCYNREGSLGIRCDVTFADGSSCQVKCNVNVPQCV